MKVMPTFSDLRPKFYQKSSAAVAVVVKPSATAIGFGLRSTPLKFEEIFSLLLRSQNVNQEKTLMHQKGFCVPKDHFDLYLP